MGTPVTSDFIAFHWRALRLNCPGWPRIQVAGHLRWALLRVVVIAVGCSRLSHLATPSTAVPARRGD